MSHFEFPVTTPISRVIEEAKDIKSFIFSHRLEARPGQFVMVWLPGVDAKPIAVSYQDEKSFGVTISAVGGWSSKVCSLKKGDLLGIMGPYGNSFKLEGKSAVMVGGGYGSASLMLLAEEALKKNVRTTFIIGARNEDFLIYRDRVKKMEMKSLFTTDDGSFGQKRHATDALEEILKSEKPSKAFAVGPELMERKFAEICKENGVRCEVSIERYMKCGFGTCGACCTDGEGKRVCVEGTVLSGEEALKMKEFGKYHRDGSATKRDFGGKK